MNGKNEVMPNEGKDRTAIFTDQDRLQLLQLTTRRSMSERRDKESREQTLEKHLEEIPAVIPDKWRLVPDGVVLYEWQKECLPIWLSEGRGTVKVATGGGKTLFALAAAEKIQQEKEPDLRLVIVVPTIPLMYQWYDEVKNGNLPDSTIGLMGAGRDLPPLSELRVLICVLASARKELPKLVKNAGWAKRMLLIVDECHRANAKQARHIFDSNPRFTLGLSATPEQELDEDSPADTAYDQSPVGVGLGPIIYDFTLQQSVDAGLLTPFEVWHIGLPLTPDEAIKHGQLSREISELKKSLERQHRSSRSKQNFLAWCQTQASRAGSAATEATRFIGLANQRKRLLYQAKAREEVTLGILSHSVSDPDGRAIVFHESIKEIERLFLRALTMNLPAVLEHSQLSDGLRAENIEAFRRGVARVIVSAKSLVEGFNVPSADQGIIMASTSSVRQRIQSLGRMLRRKTGARSARVVVLYIRDTEDEAIYEKADWENVIGAERNRYFHWRCHEQDESWESGLTETETPPRSFRPPSWQVNVEQLSLGDSYPGQVNGSDLKVDQDNNLRTEEGTLVRAPSEIIEEIVRRNPFRRARCTPAGHLIVRRESQDKDDTGWQFLTIIELPEEPGPTSSVRLHLQTNRGRREIARKEDRGRNMRFALGPTGSKTQEAGRARDKLLEWIRNVEAERGITIKELHWDGDIKYWLEIAGERIEHDESLAPLEFSS